MIHTPKVLIFGKTGQIGRALIQKLMPSFDVVGLGRQDLEFTNPATLSSVIRGMQPRIVINAAAYTQVERAEREPDRAEALNAHFPEILATACRDQSAFLIHYSTDYVFDGSKMQPYLETDIPLPLNVYGTTKLQGERRIMEILPTSLILRTSGVYAPQGRNFLRAVLSQAQEKEELKVVIDQVMAPNSSQAIAAATARILELGIASDFKASGLSGIVHLSAPDATNWFEFASEILNQTSHLKRPFQKLLPIKTSEITSVVKRPLYTFLSSIKIKDALGIELAPWRTQLRDVLSEAVRG